MQKGYKMEEILEAIKLSAVKIKHLIDNGDTGASENTNSTGDTQLKLDIASDELIEEIFKNVKSVKAIVSEEKDVIVSINKDANLVVAYDPLDGSSLVDVNLSVGTIYGIYDGEFSGDKIVASVYIVYGPRVELVLAVKNSVKLFRLSGEEFVFIKDINLNNKGVINCPGSTQSNWYQHHRNMVENMFEEGYKLRYSGGMVPDLHQILLSGGGLFSYPGTTDKPKGKLRQLFEVFPFAFAFENAGGGAIDGNMRALEAKTEHIHDTLPCFFGSNYEINFVKEAYARAN